VKNLSKILFILTIFLGISVLADSKIQDLFLQEKWNEAYQLAKSKKDFLWLARISFQKQNYKDAALYYEHLSKNDSNYLKTREELAWSYMHLGDWSRLRGLLIHLNTELVPLPYRLEGRVLAAISALKECQYDEVEVEIKKFQNEIFPLAKNQSLRPLVSEAVTKMQYVRLEFLSQLQMLQKLQKKQDLLASTNRVADIGDEASRAIIQRAEDRNQLVFPVQKNDVWVDELFELRSLSASECDRLQKRDL
jgi:hypothetical protein